MPTQIEMMAARTLAMSKHNARARVAETKRLHAGKSKVPAWLRDIHPASPDDAAASRACSGEND